MRADKLIEILKRVPPGTEVVSYDEREDRIIHFLTYAHYMDDNKIELI